MEIKQANVYKEYKLLEKDGNNFVLNEHRKLEKGHSVISEDMAERFNSNYYSSGLYYELDVEATALLHKDINQRRLEKIARANKTTYSKPEPQPQIVEVKTTLKEIKPETEINLEQQKYDKRKQKLIDAGFEFDEAENIFVKGEKIIKAEEVLSIAPVTFGKLTKK